MRFKSVPTAIVVKREEKEGQIRAFIERHLSAWAEIATDTKAFLFVARSPDSPSARALLTLGDKIAASGIRLEVIFAMIDRPNTPWTSTDGAPFAREIRLVSNPRLLDAHEQLVLGDRTAWVGDCMRRDPDKRDAYESFGDDALEISRHAQLSFQRLWARAEPVCIRTMLLDSEQALQQPAFTPPGDAGTGTLAATRH